MDVISLRGVFLESRMATEHQDDLKVGDVKNGGYPGQGGSFDIDTKALLLGICVWTNNTVEIQVINRDSGEIVEIRTLENTNEIESTEAINESIEKNT